MMAKEFPDHAMPPCRPPPRPLILTRSSSVRMPVDSTKNKVTVKSSIRQMTASLEWNNVRVQVKNLSISTALYFLGCHNIWTMGGSDPHFITSTQAPPWLM